ncbi:helix-turn-helix transcriptional regulator [Ottowia sp.]|uniref:helix-turn-helix transcriptional regulator n=1 Tax=Ottowia sp. TaxID=1898956 RepID=UPI003A83FB20
MNSPASAPPNVAQQLAEATWNDGAWPQALRSLQRLFDGVQYCFRLESHPDDVPPLVVCNANRDLALSYPQLRDTNPFLPRLRCMAPGTVLTDEALMPARDFHRTEFYDAWYTTQDLHHTMAMNVAQTPDTTNYVVLHRSQRQGPFEAAEAALLQSLLPLLQQTIHARLRLGQTHWRDRIDALEHHHAAVLLISADGCMIYANGVAQTLLESSSFPLQVQRGVLMALEPDDDARLQALVRSACHTSHARALGGNMALREQGRLAAQINVSALRHTQVMGLPVERAACVIVCVLSASSVPCDAPARFRAVFGLSEKEAALAADLARGAVLKDIARYHQIGIATARTHLGHVFRKTGTSHQGELVALLLQTLAAPSRM